MLVAPGNHTSDFLVQYLVAGLDGDCEFFRLIAESGRDGNTSSVLLKIIQDMSVPRHHYTKMV